VGLISGKGEMHNNLVYPLLRRFVESGWVSKRKGPGERGQTRDIYALTNGQATIAQAPQPIDG
jgi:DNA-binding PadR family transcriptional regulator